MTDFPVHVVTKGEVVEVSFPGGTLSVCAHGARELARMIIESVDAGPSYCDGYRHGGPETMFVGFKVA